MARTIKAPAEPEAQEQTEQQAEGQQEQTEQPGSEAPEGFIPMIHPEGGTCDAYNPDENGVHLVPLENIAAMLAHGFVPKEG